MKKILLGSIFFFIIFPCFSVDNTNPRYDETYVKFVSGSIADKTEILENLKISENTPILTARLPEKALMFVSRNFKEIGIIKGMKELAAVAIPHISITNSNQAELLWDIFEIIDDNDIRLEIILKMNFAYPKQKLIVETFLPEIHDFIANSVENGFYTRTSCLAAIELLGKVSDASSFDLLFKLLCSDYNDLLSSSVVAALDSILPKTEDFILNFINKETLNIKEKLLLFDLILKNENFSSVLKSEIAQNILYLNIINIEKVSNVNSDVKQLQMLAIRRIKDSAWMKAASTVSDFFPIAVQEFEYNILNEQELIEIIDCLRTLATTQSVAVLSSYLGTINNEVAKEIFSYNENIILAVIKTLGVLGDKMAFDNLLYVTYLPYSEQITSAASIALAGLKW